MTKASKSLKASGIPEDEPVLHHFTGVQGFLQKGECKKMVSLVKGLREH